MKKLFTLVALLAMVLGANAQAGKWEQVYTIDYSTYSGFPFYVMGYVPEFDNGCMTDFGSDYRYETQANLDGDGDGKWKDGESSVGTVKNQGGTEYQKVTGAGPYWHQYFIADGIPTKIDGKYKVVAKVRATGACTINVNMGNWGDGNALGCSVSIPESAEFTEVEWQYTGMPVSSAFLVAQPGTCAETIEWLSLTVYEWQKEGQRPKEWIEDIVNGDAETPWGDLANVAFNDQENNFKICAWTKEREVLMNADGGWDPYPSPIEEEEGNPSNHVFVVHGKAATTEGAASAWDNQFWIQSQHSWKSGTTLKIKFRYKASKTVKVATQIHKQNPSDYLHYVGIGDVNFTTEWQEMDKTITFDNAQGGGWSIAFQLNENDKEAIDFYFDDLSWKYLKLDEGYFVSGINSNTTKEYDDLDNAIEFAEEDGLLVATVGEPGNAASYVNQLMISTTRGDDQAFKGATLKPTGKIHNDPDDWQEYAESVNAKLNLPGLGVWKIYLDTAYKAIAFEMLEGTPDEEPDPIAIVTNKTPITVKGQEREDLKDEWNANTSTLNVREEADNNPDDEHGLGGEGHNGQTWDNQFFIKANRALAKGEVTILKFKYKGSVEAKTTTQCHGETPGSYLHWAAIGDVTFTTEWQDFEQEFTVPNEADGMWCIAFNMAEIKEACDYEITDVQWYLKDDVNAEGLTSENLINEEGDSNFYVKEGAGTTPYIPSGIINVINDATTGSNVIYNLSGQRVTKDYKGIVIINGRKVVNK